MRASLLTRPRVVLADPRVRRWVGLSLIFVAPDVNEAAHVFKPDRFTAVLLHPASAKIAPAKPVDKKKAPKKS